MLVKKIILASALCLPLMATAGNLTLVNNTNRDSTSIINSGLCSTILKEAGITRAHTTNVVPESKVNMACMLNRANCVADVYMTDNCSGPVVATVVLDTTTGIKSVVMKDASYQIAGTGFTVELNGGPN